MTELAFWFLIFALIYVLSDWGSTCIFGGKSNWGFIESNKYWRRLGVFGSLIIGLLVVTGLSLVLDSILIFLGDSYLAVLSMEIPLVIMFVIWSAQIAHNLVVGYQDSR